jgi:prolyl-tRNA synthetase
VRYSRLFAPTLKQDPADAEVVSHKLLVRAGMIRQVARGIYDFLPLGLRVIRNLESIVRDELDRAGAQELLMPAVCPAELWQESGRWDQYGKELLRIKDRHERDFCFGPTHEEMITDIVRREVRSYRNLPLNLYQIQVKFRDEVRPRFGLMRGREFIMKDGYSFHVDAADCEREYQNMSDAYGRIFARCGLAYRAVEADTGAIGGSMSHEFQVLADSGEDAIAICGGCGYTANVEKASVRAPADRRDVAAGGAPNGSALRKVHTPDVRTVEEVGAFLDARPERFIKTLLYQIDTGAVVAALVRGDHEVSDAKLRAALGVQAVALADATTVERVTGAPVGFAGPLGLTVHVVADLALLGLTGGITGANERDHHLVGIDQSRDLGGVRFVDLRGAREGDGCARCAAGRFEVRRGIEVGQVFYLGTKYSRPMKATFLDAGGVERPIEMGTYGIGITRTMAAAVEQNHDDGGIIWPLPLAPFQALVVPISVDDTRQRETAERIYGELRASGVDALLDDRPERAGVKFKDADLIGIPHRVTIGPRGLDRGCVELKARRAGAAVDAPIDAAAARVAADVKQGLAR